VAGSRGADFLVVSSYEEFTGNKFPEAIRDKFIPMVNMMRDAYRQAERVPGVMLGQEIAGGVMQITAKVAWKVLNGIRKKGDGCWQMNRGGFSRWRFLGISGLKSHISRKIGIPLTK